MKTMPLAVGILLLGVTGPVAAPAAGPPARDAESAEVPAAPRRPARLSLLASVSIAWDSNVPQARATRAAPLSPVVPGPGAASLGAMVALTFVPLGTPPQGLLLHYRFAQTAHLSRALDRYSQQTHEVEAALALKGGRLRLQAAGSGSAWFAGVLGMTPSQLSAAPALQLSIAEVGGLSTRLRYEHGFRLRLGEGGSAGDVLALSLAQHWEREIVTLALGYQLTQDRPGQRRSAEGYLSHQLSLTAGLELPWSLGASTTLRYEARDAPSRRDHTLALQLELERSLHPHLSLGLVYGVTASRFAGPAEQGFSHRHLAQAALTLAY